MYGQLDYGNITGRCPEHGTYHPIPGGDGGCPRCGKYIYQPTGKVFQSGKNGEPDKEITWPLVPDGGIRSDISMTKKYLVLSMTDGQYVPAILTGEELLRRINPESAKPGNPATTSWYGGDYGIVFATSIEEMGILDRERGKRAILIVFEVGDAVVPKAVTTVTRFELP